MEIKDTDEEECGVFAKKTLKDSEDDSDKGRERQ